MDNEDEMLKMIGRGSRRGRNVTQPATQFPRRERKVHFSDVVDGSDGSDDYDAYTEDTPASALVPRMRQSSMYAPLAFMASGALLCGGGLNLYYLKFPPKEMTEAQSDKEKRKARKERIQKTLVSGVIGGVFGFIAYLLLFKSKKSANEDFDEE